jgi:hypothetical protein
MDLLSRLNLISIPWTTKAAIVLLLAFLGAVNTWLFFEALWVTPNKDVVVASVQLLSVVLPIFLLALLIARADTGTRALTRRTSAILTQVIPEALRSLIEEQGTFYAPSRNGKDRSPRANARTHVSVNHAQGECYTDYRIETRAPAGEPGHRLHIRVELNVRKANFNLYLPRLHVCDQGGADARSLEEISKELMQRFRHTIEGAAMHCALIGEEGAISLAGYTFNTVAIERRLDGDDYVCLVAKKDLPRDFLWNSSEQLYFANDLKLMVRSFLREAPEYFTMQSRPRAIASPS